MGRSDSRSPIRHFARSARHPTPPRPSWGSGLRRRDRLRSPANRAPQSDNTASQRTIELTGTELKPHVFVDTFPNVCKRSSLLDSSRTSLRSRQNNSRGRLVLGTLSSMWRLISQCISQWICEVLLTRCLENNVSTPFHLCGPRLCDVQFGGCDVQLGLP